MAIIVGIGGTGARCVEAFAYLAASGAVTPGGDSPAYKFLLLDQDSAGNSFAAERAKNQIVAFFGAVGKSSCFQSFDGTDPHTKKLVLAAGYQDNLRGTVDSTKSDAGASPKLATLAGLFSPEARAMRFDEGYVQQANLGALHLALRMGMDTASADVVKELVNAQLAREKMFVFGSVFGGMGASGIPALAQVIQSRLGESEDRTKFRAVAALGSYFTIPKDDGGQSHAIHPEDRHAAVASANALEHYLETDLAGLYSRIYFLAPRVRALTHQGYARGGDRQKNLPHVAELVAATAADDFLSKKAAEPGLLFCQADGPGWESIPRGADLAVSLRRHRLVAQYLVDRLPASFFKTDSDPRRFWDPIRGLSWAESALAATSRKDWDVTKAREGLSSLRQYAAGFIGWAGTIVGVPQPNSEDRGKPWGQVIAPSRAELQALSDVLDSTARGTDCEWHNWVVNGPAAWLYRQLTTCAKAVLTSHGA